MTRELNPAELIAAQELFRLNDELTVACGKVTATKVALNAATDAHNQAIEAHTAAKAALMAHLVRDITG